jgi:hypothetical protein
VPWWASIFQRRVQTAAEALCGLTDENKPRVAVLHSRVESFRSVGVGWAARARGAAHVAT